MKQKLQKITKTLLFCFVIILLSCEKEGISTIQNTEAKNNNISIKYVSGKNIPNIISKLNPDYSSTFKSSSSKSNMITDSFGSISTENILEVIDSLGNKNYSFTLSPKKPKPNSIFNLVISTSNGNKDMAIVEYRMAPDFAQDYYNGTKSISEFTGRILRFPFKDASNLFYKTNGNTCIQNIDEVVNCDEIIVDGGNIISSGGGGGSTTISDTNTYTGGDGGTVTHNYGGGSAYWVCNRYGVSHSGPTSCGDGSGTWVITLPDSHTNKLSNPKSKTSGTSCCDDTIIVGTVGVNLFDLAVSIRDILGFSGRSQESLWLINNATIEQIASISNFLNENNNSIEAVNFSKELITQMMLNPALILDATTSFKSPFNVDKSTITDATPEGAKFNVIYDALTKSPEFKALFLDLFQDPSNRFNVKFVIEDHVYRENNPAKEELNGSTQPQLDKSMLIKINKQILTALASRPLKDIEIARTILHESIHAYLMIKGKNPVSPGIAIPGIENMTLDEVINATFADSIPQHNFMYNHMIPTMQTVLTQIRDLLTTQARRSEVESLRMHPDLANLRNTIPWNWNDYFKYLSLIGLGEANSFKTDYPNPSNAYNLYREYVTRGHQYLDGN